MVCSNKTRMLLAVTLAVVGVTALVVGISAALRGENDWVAPLVAGVVVLTQLPIVLSRTSAGCCGLFRKRSRDEAHRDTVAAAEGDATLAAADGAATDLSSWVADDGATWRP
jgi:hypothetical protein